MQNSWHSRNAVSCIFNHFIVSMFSFGDVVPIGANGVWPSFAAFLYVFFAFNVYLYFSPVAFVFRFFPASSA